jgi:ribose transport system ATP-binding protein
VGLLNTPSDSLPGVGHPAGPRDAPAGARGIRFSGISKRYPGVQALDAVSLECFAGEVHAVVGENGSGKSTLLSIASGVVGADEGTIELDGQSLTHPRPSLARRLGVTQVYQSTSLVLDLTVAENLFLSAPPAHRPQRYGAIRRWASAQLADYGLAVEATQHVRELSAAQRQLLEVVKALIARPRILLLDEPTIALGPAQVEQLHAAMQREASRGVAVVYVSHRLPEVLSVAQRVTVLRDGQCQGTQDAASLTEHDLVAMMTGVAPEREFPPHRRVTVDAAVVLSVRGLRGAGFGPVDLAVRRGETLGIAGADGNGQAEVLRALAGLVTAEGSVSCDGREVPLRSPQDALRSGILLLSGDRKGESTFQPLSVCYNATLQVLEKLRVRGLLSRRREHATVSATVDQLAVRTPSLDQPIRLLSGGNQQKIVMGRAFLHDACILLVEQPTQGVDVGARADIYRALRTRSDAGTATVVTSSDAHELAGICDRVIVLSRGRVTRELSGADLDENRIVGSFVGSHAQRDRGDQAAATAESRRRAARLTSWFSAGWAPLALLGLLIVLLAGYAAAQTPTFLSSVNIQSLLLAVIPLALVAMAEVNALLVAGFDISIGALMGLVVVTASFLIAEGGSTPALILGLTGCLAVGLIVGAFNGLLIRGIGLTPVVATIATLSILQGTALTLRSVPGGIIASTFTDALNATVGFLPVSFLCLVVLAVGWDRWLYHTAGGLATRATGHDEEASRRIGIPTTWFHVRAYLLSGLLAALAGLFLAAAVGVGDASVGNEFALTGIAAAVLGGASLFGGRGSFIGAIVGALLLSLIANIIPLLAWSTAIGLIASGVFTLLAVMLYSGRRLWTSLAAALRSSRARRFRQRRRAA